GVTKNNSLGIVVAKFDLLKLLDSVERFNHLEYSSLRLQLKNDLLVSASSLARNFSYTLTAQPNVENMTRLISSNIAYFIFLVLLLNSVVFYFLYRLILRPYSQLSGHVDHLRSGSVQAITPDSSSFLTVSEHTNLQAVVNKYIDQIEINSERDEEICQLKQQAAKFERASEKAQDASKAKSSFLANTSHEIRTPLTAIIGFAETSLDKEANPAERDDAIQTVIRSAKHLLQIINDILDLSKVEANKLDIVKFANVSPFQIVAEVEGLIKLYAVEKQVQFNTQFILPLPAAIVTDPIRLKQIIINLANNAIKFSGSGHVLLTVSYNLREQNIRFSIIDTGVGLSTEQIEKVFDPFVQAESTTTRRFGGTGLGLSLSKQLASLLGGNLLARSHLGIGSQFTLKLSLADSPADNFICDYDRIPSAANDVITTDYAKTIRGRILIAEDNKVNQRLLEIYLQRFGMSVTIVDNGEQAVDRALTQPFDVILMDMQMPVMDGIAAVKMLRKKGCKIPIVALTANAFSEDRQACMNAGFSEYLTKPIDRQRLYQVLKYYINRSKKESVTYTSVEQTPIVSQLLDSDPDLIDLLEKFVRTLPSMISDIQLAAQKHAWKELQALAHDLKGVSGNYGFPALCNLAAEIENHLVESDYVNICSQIEALMQLQNRVVVSTDDNVQNIRQLNGSSGI
ncbi:MAG: response regulator, partial [Thiohalomonadales bacterium]